MPYANPEIYGAPETWKGNYLFGGLTGDKSREFRCTKPLVPYKGYECCMFKGVVIKESNGSYHWWKSIDQRGMISNE